MSLFKNLIRNQTANVMYLTAAATFPILAMIGGGVDMGRAYMAQNRLQNACDAGVLAARRVQTTSNISMDAAARQTGEDYFDHNFRDGLFGVETGDATFTIADGGEDSSVAGTASVVVDYSIMPVFGFDSTTISVNCGAEVDAQNTDVMLVLDLTLSMNQTLGGEKKIDALRDAVEEFFDIVNATKVADVNQVRFGFVPYAGTVNVGKILMDENPEWVIGGVSTNRQHPYHTFASSNASSELAEEPDIGVNNVGVKSYVQTLGTGSDTRVHGRSSEAEWAGCVEARGSNNTIDGWTTTIPADAYDLDIDLIPDLGDNDTRWAPYYPEVVVLGNGNDVAKNNYQCPGESRKLAEYDDYDDIRSYIDGQELALATNQVAGLVWGARLLSPTGLFASENATAPNAEYINRHIVFMTDGKLWLHHTHYGSHGINDEQGRFAPTGTSRANLNKLGYNRMALVCDQIKAMGITIWTVEFESDAVVSDSLVDCASSSDHSFAASNPEELTAAFSSIGSAVGGLRLSE